MHTPSFEYGNPRLILASGSVYRSDLLARLRLPFDVVVPGVIEQALPGETPAATAARLALEKATAVAANAPNALVIGSDQVAEIDGEPIGKPGSHDNALAQLRRMRARTVVFHTAVCLVDSRGKSANSGTASRQAMPQSAVVETVVQFRDLSDTALDAYLRIEQPYDCAGSAKNEGLGIALIQSCQSSDPTALTGLPLIALSGMLYNAGVVFFAAGAA